MSGYLPSGKKGPHRCGPSLVELPGIEPATENDLTCANCDLATRNYAKQLPKTWGNAADVDGTNAMSLLLR
jgi:hypothetical protein